MSSRAAPQPFAGYAHLNLRFNPFGCLTPQEEARVALPALETRIYAARLRRRRNAIQFLGPSGRGKTTHLMTLHRHFPGAPYVYVARGEPVPPIPEASILFIDEMQRVARRQRRDLLARGVSYVVGSHADHSREFAGAGLDYEVIRLGAVSAARLQAILNRRISFACRHPRHPLPLVTTEAAEMLLARCGADQWAMNGILYDVFETLASTNALEKTLATYLSEYRLPWQRRLLRFERPAFAGVIEFIVR